MNYHFGTIPNISGGLLFFKKRFTNPESIFHMALIVLKTNILVNVLFLCISVILVRHLSKADYGLWRVVASIAAFCQLLFVGFDHAIIRFVPVESRAEADSIVLSAFVMKLSATAVGITLLIALYPYLPGWLNLPNESMELFPWIFWLMMLSTLITPIATTLFPLASAHKLFDQIFRVSVFKQAAMLVCVLVIVGADLGIAQYIACELVLSIAQIVVLWHATLPLAKEKGGDLWGGICAPDAYRRIWPAWQRYLKGYAMPLSFTSLLSYARGHLPVILVGSAFSLKDAAIYSILKNVMTVIHKTEGSIVEGVFPRMFELYEVGRTAFVKKFYRYMTFTYLARGVVGAAIFIGAPFIFWIYKIENEPYLRIVLFILVLDFLLTEILNVSNIVMMISKRTTMLLFSAGFRFVFEAFLLVFVTLRFGILGAAITLFLSRAAETISTVYFSNRIFPLKRQYALVGLMIAVFVFALAQTELK